MIQLSVPASTSSAFPLFSSLFSFLSYPQCCCSTYKPTIHVQTQFPIHHRRNYNRQRIKIHQPRFRGQRQRPCLWYISKLPFSPSFGYSQKKKLNLNLSVSWQSASSTANIVSAFSHVKISNQEQNSYLTTVLISSSKHKQYQYQQQKKIDYRHDSGTSRVSEFSINRTRAKSFRIMLFFFVFLFFFLISPVSVSIKSTSPPLFVNVNDGVDKIYHRYIFGVGMVQSMALPGILLADFPNSKYEAIKIYNRSLISILFVSNTPL